MNLPETFELVRPTIVALFSRIATMTTDAPPMFPDIIGTGFLVHEDGIVVTNTHVIEALEGEPPHPESGVPSVGALVFPKTISADGETVLPMINADILSMCPLQHFDIEEPWYGEALPDLGFVQIKLRGTPFLRFLTDRGAMRVGMPIATAGFASGTDAIVYHRKLTQLTPILRHGIVSSVFPFASPNPHGFSIDALVQGGASGSPVFLTEEPTVIGMIESKIPDSNFTVCVPGNIIHSALRSFLESSRLELDGVPTMKDLLEADRGAWSEELKWDRFIIPPEGNT